MAEIAHWNNHSFVVSPSIIRGFNDLTIKSGMTSDNKTSGSQTYIARKSGDAYELSMTVTLSQFTGCNVRDEAMKLLEEARLGNCDFFYIGGVKLVTCLLMLTNASVEEVDMNGSATWISCKVKLTFKQCTPMDFVLGTSLSTNKSSSSGSKSSGSGSNSKKSTITGSYATMNASQLTVNKSMTKQDIASNAAKAKAATKAASTSSKTTKVQKASRSGKTTTSTKKSTTTTTKTASKITYASIASTIANR